MYHIILNEFKFVFLLNFTAKLLPYYLMEKCV